MKPAVAITHLRKLGRNWFATSPENYIAAVRSARDFLEFDPRFGLVVNRSLETLIEGLVDVGQICMMVEEDFGRPVAGVAEARTFLRLLQQDLFNDTFGGGDDDDTDVPF